MAALVTVHNDGPDHVEILFGKQRRLLYAGQSFRVATTSNVEVAAVPKMSDEELHMHMGGPAVALHPEKYRSAED